MDYYTYEQLVTLLWSNDRLVNDVTPVREAIRKWPTSALIRICGGTLSPFDPIMKAVSDEIDRRIPLKLFGR